MGHKQVFSFLDWLLWWQLSLIVLSISTPIKAQNIELENTRDRSFCPLATCKNAVSAQNFETAPQVPIPPPQDVLPLLEPIPEQLPTPAPLPPPEDLLQIPPIPKTPEPLNPRDGTLSFSYGTSSSDVIESPFNLLDINASSRYYDLSLRQPIIQTPNQEFALGLTAARRESDAFLYKDYKYLFLLPAQMSEDVPAFPFYNFFKIGLLATITKLSLLVLNLV